MGTRTTAVSKTWPWLLVLALVGNLALAGGPAAGTSQACSCASMPLKDEIEGSDAVFSGEVQSIAEGATPDRTSESTAPGFVEATGKVSISVQDSWKGVTAEVVEIYGQGDGGNCYNIFEEGEAYIVYASREGVTGGPAPLENNACGATKLLADAEADLQALGSPQAGCRIRGDCPRWRSVGSCSRRRQRSCSPLFSASCPTGRGIEVPGSPHDHSKGWAFGLWSALRR